MQQTRPEVGPESGPVAAPLSAVGREAPDLRAIKRVQRPFWSRLLTRQVQFVLDLAVLVGAFCIAYLLRFEFDLPSGLGNVALIQLPVVLLVQMGALGFFGVYAFIWRYVGLSELHAFGKSAVASLAVLVLMRFSLQANLQGLRIPLSVIFIDSVLGFSGVVSLRVLRRVLYERYERNRLGTGQRRKKPVLFVGAGRAGVMAAREVMARSDLDIELRGFVDDDATKHGSVLFGVKVLGPTSMLPELVKDLQIDHVVVTIARATRGSMRRILDVCEEIGVKVRVIPGLFELLDGKVEVNRIRDVQIEDLLGRDPVQLDEAGVQSFLSDKVVLVTGAGGSIGSELCRQVARFGPRKLLLVERSENALFLVDKELRAHFPDLPIIPLMADLLDGVRIEHILGAHQPEVVFHAAAHKHVPMMEENPGEAVKNNVFGTRLLAEACDRAGVGRFVMISTDKAVNPTSVMGATKRIAELYVQALAARSRTRFVAVRFGNVLGSNGSVVPIFKTQIAAGGPVTITHPDMKRYFMTIPEAAQLVLQAGTMGQGGEIFVLDMGEPMKIVDLARDLITLSGLRPGVDIAIEFTGLRPGEKLFEELSVADENASKTQHPKIFVGKLRSTDLEPLRRDVDALRPLVDAGDAPALLQRMQQLVPEFGSKAPTPAEREIVRTPALAGQPAAAGV